MARERPALETEFEGTVYRSRTEARWAVFFRVRGRAPDGTAVEVQLTPEGSPAANYGFDVTPARLITGLITERGICPASREGLLGLYPERR